MASVTFTAVDDIPRARTAHVTRRFRLDRTGYLAGACSRCVNAEPPRLGSACANLSSGLVTVRFSAVFSLCCRPRASHRYPVPVRARRLWEDTHTYAGTASDPDAKSHRRDSHELSVAS
ncbi:hypothetical protein TsFJ059_001623 [Trichoderma semiorbis]|uniref:Uncharacterized protein n=1 Tax=Trichoderma semiorbis TaxID=1491008 RepID=A0A9P8HXT1_9HYPO|nr:hypothetical protein TsFJ059_001623 [Trichoderma semiorbis]